MEAHEYGKIRGKKVETNFDDVFKLHTLKGLPLGEFVIHCLVMLDSVAKGVKVCERYRPHDPSTTKQASGTHGASGKKLGSSGSKTIQCFNGSAKACAPNSSYRNPLFLLAGRIVLGLLSYSAFKTASS